MITPEDIPHIESAIDCARLSKDEDDRPKPRVGAVLVKDGAVIGSAFRCETAPGDHAEFGLLEKKLTADHVAGATLYTTLEPCTLRNDPKVACAERVVERRLARVVIGILDPNQHICGRGVRRLRKAGIEVDLFPLGYMAQVEDQNREFIRHHERLAALELLPPMIGLTLERVELEPAPDWVFKFKLRLYWLNDGATIDIGEPRWIPGGMAIQGNEMGYKFQTWVDGKWGREIPDAHVLASQRVRIYVGLDPTGTELAAKLLETGRLGTLVLPVTTAGRQIELMVRPRSSVFSK